LDAIFKDPQVKYGLREFSKLKIEEVITVFEKEKDKFYIHCLKRDKDIAFNSTRNIRNRLGLECKSRARENFQFHTEH